MPANFLGQETPGGTPIRRRSQRAKTAQDLPRRALLYLSALVLAAVTATLALTGHTSGWSELSPLAISCLGLVAIGNVLYEPDRSARSLLWLTSALVAIGGSYGIYSHIDRNFDAARALDPQADGIDILIESLVGRNPLIAPALMIAAAALAVAGSALASVPDDDTEVDSLIAAALLKLDERNE